MFFILYFELANFEEWVPTREDDDDNDDNDDEVPGPSPVKKPKNKLAHDDEVLFSKLSYHFDFEDINLTRNYFDHRMIRLSQNLRLLQSLQDNKNLSIHLVGENPLPKKNQPPFFSTRWKRRSQNSTPPSTSHSTNISRNITLSILKT